MKDLGNGNNMQGALAFNDTGAEAKGYDVGIGFGTAGIGKDDVGSVSFDLKSSCLKLEDFVGMDFGVRMTSVGTKDGPREDSCKLTSSSFQPIDDLDEDIDCVLENNRAEGSLIDAVVEGANGLKVYQTLTSFKFGDTTYTFDDDNTSFEIALDDTEGAKLIVNNDGTYKVVGGGDALGADEHFEFQITYTVHQVYKDASGDVIGQLDDTSTLDFDICGENDDPVAVDDDAGCVVESGLITGNVIAGTSDGEGAVDGVDDSDVDRTDTLKVTHVDGNALDFDTADAEGYVTVNLASGAILKIKADGAYVYDPNGAFDDLDDGEEGDDSFEYTVSDCNGGSDTAIVTLCIEGEGDGGGGGGDPPPEHFFNNGHDLSYATFYFGTTSGDTRGVYNGEPAGGNNPPDGVYTVKINGFPDGNGGDLDDFYDDILAYIIDNNPNVDENTVVLGVAIHAGGGNPETAELFYAIDGDEDSDPYPDPPVDKATGNEVDLTIDYDTIFV